MKTLETYKNIYDTQSLKKIGIMNDNKIAKGWLGESGFIEVILDYIFGVMVKGRKRLGWVNEPLLFRR